MNDLPNTWQNFKLSEIIEEIEAGVRPKGGVKDISEGYPSLGAEHLTSEGKFNFKKLKFIPTDFAATVNRGKISEGDILIVKDGATTSKVSFVDEDFPFITAYVNEHVFRCKIYEDFGISKFFYWFLYSPVGKQEILNNFRGAAQGGIIKSFTQNVNVPIPPLEEQKQIVMLVDGAMNKLANAKMRLDSVLEIKKRLRNAIINSAASGDLTSKWRLINKATEWQSVSLVDVVVEKPRNGYSPKPVDYETPIKSLTLAATTSGTFNPSNFKYIDEEIVESSYLWLSEGDILIQRGNSIDYVGVSAIYKGASKAFIYPDLMMKIQPNEKVSSEFLYYILSSQNTRDYFRINATGVAGSMPKINQQVVSSTPIQLPSLAEQKEIVRRTENLLLLVEGLGKKHEDALKKINHINDLVLKNAFKGGLTKTWREQNKLLKSIGTDVSVKLAKATVVSKQNKLKKERTMKNNRIIPIIEVLEKSDRPLSSEELLQHSGYPNDASVDDIEKFFIDIRTELLAGNIKRERQGSQDFFQKVKG